MDVLIDWESIPWKEAESEPGYREKTCTRDGVNVWFLEFTEGCDVGWITERHVFVFHVVEGESSVRFKDGRLIRVRQGDSGIILPGEVGTHRVEVAPGKRCVIVDVEHA